MGTVLTFTTMGRGGHRPPRTPGREIDLEELAARRLLGMADLAQALSRLPALQQRGLVPPAAAAEGWEILRDLAVLEIPPATGADDAAIAERCMDELRRITDRLQSFHETYTAHLPAAR